MTDASTGPLRETWSFPFAVSELQTACEERARAHLDHVRYWKQRLATWEAEMGRTAKVEEVPITGGIQRVLRYDEGLQRKVAHARDRLDAHRAEALKFERWLLALSKLDPSDQVRLRYGDIAFFFAKIDEPPEGDS